MMHRGRFQCRAIHIDAVARAAFHAAELGLEVAVFVESDQMLDALSVLDTLNEEARRRIPVETFETPRTRQ